VCVPATCANPLLAKSTETVRNKVDSNNIFELGPSSPKPDFKQDGEDVHLRTKGNLGR
jgi:hypothetical protein